MNYKIFNWKGQQLMVIEADWMKVDDHGQIELFKNDQSWPVAVFPDGTLVAQSNVVNHKEKEFDFTGQKEKIAKRNEHIFADQTRNFKIGEVEDDGKRSYTKKPKVDFTNTERELYDLDPADDHKPFELKAAKESMVSTGNGKLDENQEERVVNEIEESKLEEKKRKNREYQAKLYREKQAAKGKTVAPYEPNNYRDNHNADLTNMKTQGEKKKEKQINYERDNGQKVFVSDEQFDKMVNRGKPSTDERIDETVNDLNDNTDNWIWE